MWERFEYCLWNIIVKLHFVGLLATLKYFCKMESTFCRERFFVSHFLSCFAIYFLLLFCSSYCFENISRNNGLKKNRIDILHSFKGKNSNCLAVYAISIFVICFQGAGSANTDRKSFLMLEPWEVTAVLAYDPERQSVWADLFVTHLVFYLHWILVWIFIIDVLDIQVLLKTKVTSNTDENGVATLLS